jgi:hypothetical protein
MKVKSGIHEQYKALFILPQIWITWDHIFCISFCWLKWGIDVEFSKK